jgi:fido (protein-threonine AMPylation protein)
VCKYQFLASEIYLPGTVIPRNRLGIEDGNLLHEVEETLLQQAYRIFIGELQPAVRFDENYFKSLHQRTFAALYDWAGAYPQLICVKPTPCSAMPITLLKNQNASSGNWNRKHFSRWQRSGQKKNYPNGWLTISAN